jgi:signal transduction histidine kinase
VLAAETVADFAAANPGAPRPRIALETDLPVSVDPDEVRRVLINLVDNAVRYGGREGTVRVTTRRAERDAIVEVQDSGPGIAEIDLERIFEPFFRLQADASSPPGSGLGLAIARSLAERNGGHLTVTSHVGTGSTFRMALPRFR